MLTEVEIRRRRTAGRKPLDGRAAIVTGSTSGIGLGIATAFAEAGAAVMLNGFGDVADIEGKRRDLSEANDVDVGYSAADMSKPEAILRHGRGGGRTVRRHRHRGQQRRHPARRADRILPAREVGSDSRHQSFVGFPSHSRHISGDEGARLRPHHQYRLGARPHRLAVQVRLCRCQTRHRRTDQGRWRSRARKRASPPTPSVLDTCGRRWWRSRSPTRRRLTGLHADVVVRDILLSKQPTRKFATVEELGALSVFLASEAAASITGAAFRSMAAGRRSRQKRGGSS